MRVLIVEDEAKLARLVHQGLSEDGHEVTIATDGCEALVIAERSVFRCHRSGVKWVYRGSTPPKYP
jgi:DNA-binding response OmpR family regulator